MTFCHCAGKFLIVRTKDNDIQANKRTIHRNFTREELEAKKDRIVRYLCVTTTVTAHAEIHKQIISNQ